MSDNETKKQIITDLKNQQILDLSEMRRHENCLANLKQKSEERAEVINILLKD